jgi:NAD+ synthase (glutamine-hydrolysing)
VAAAQVECASADVEKNLETCIHMVVEARAAGADIVVFPELALTGAELEGRVLEVARTLKSPELRKFAAASDDITIVVGYVEEASDARFYNSVACFEAGHAIHVHRKLYLVSYGALNEGRLFAPGAAIEAFDTRVGRVATLICEDIWHPPVPYMAALDGASILITCAGSPEGLVSNAAPSGELWSAVLRAHALTFGCFHVFVNRAGEEGPLAFWGGSTVFGPSGEVVAAAPSNNPELLLAEIDLGAVREQRSSSPFLRDERVELTLRELDRIARTRFAPASSQIHGSRRECGDQQAHESVDDLAETPVDRGTFSDWPAARRDARPGTVPKERVCIPRQEFLVRQDSLRAEAERRGWPGVAVIGRGSGTYDRHGDLLYLTGHYQSFGYLHDNLPLWSGRSHALLILPVEGDPTLLVSASEPSPDVVVEDVRVSRDFNAEAGALMDRLGGGGFVGLDVVPAAMARYLPLDDFEACDEVLELLMRQKTNAERAVLRRACEVGTHAMNDLLAHALPGASEGEAVSAAAAVAYEAGAPIYLSTLAAGDRIHNFTGRPLPGFRAERRFLSGELVRYDLCIVYEGYYCDFGRSWVVGGEGQDPNKDRFVAVLQHVLEAAYAAAQPGATAGDVARAGTRAIPSDFRQAYPPHWGHGLGMAWEGPWLYPDNQEPVETGYALAIELALSDNHGNAGFGEDNLIVTDGGPEMLTPSTWTAG